MQKIVVVGDRDLCLGFGLAGVVESHEINDAAQVEPMLLLLMDREDVGMVILYDEFMNHLSVKLKNKLQTVTRPVLVTVPGKKGADEKAESLQALIKKAIGVELKN